MKLKILLDIELDNIQSTRFFDNKNEVANAVLYHLGTKNIWTLRGYLIKSLAKGTIKKELPIYE